MQNWAFTLVDHGIALFDGANGEGFDERITEIISLNCAQAGAQSIIVGLLDNLVLSAVPTLAAAISGASASSTCASSSRSQ